MKKFLTVFLLLLTASSFRADERVQCMMQDEEWVYQQDPQAVGSKSCKCKCYRCLRVGTLTVTGSATLAEASIEVLNVTTLNVINEDISGSVAIGGNLAVAGNTALAGNLAVAGNETVGGTLGVTGNISTNASVVINGVTLDSASLTTMLAQLTYANFYASPPLAVTGGNVVMGTPGPASVAPNGPITHNGTGGYVLPATGVYEVTWSLTSITGAAEQYQLQLNGNPIAGTDVFSTSVAVTGTEISGSTLISATAGDVLSLFSVTVFTPLPASTAVISIQRVS